MSPPELARHAPRLDILEPVEPGLLPRFRDDADFAARVASITGLASVAASTYHWSVSIGSITTFERSPNGCMIFLSSTLIIRPSESMSATTRLRAR